jgi:hypothetical protein
VPKHDAVCVIIPYAIRRVLALRRGIRDSLITLEEKRK